MNLQSIIRNSVLGCAVTVLCASTSWAIPVNITSNTSNPSWSQVHDGTTGGGTSIYKPLSGTLMGDLTYWAGGWKLTNIMGVLTDSSGSTVTITNGRLHDGSSENAHGWFDYNISGGSEDLTIGRFTFLNSESSNYLTDTNLQLWGGDVPNQIGMDFRAWISPKAIPEPSTVFLLGSGLAGLVGWRYLKTRA